MSGWNVPFLVEHEQPVPQGECGEICLRAGSNPHYSLGFWRNEEAGGADLRRRRRPGRGRRLLYVGRADDVIIAAGYRIGPFEVESACLEHAAVR